MREQQGNRPAIIVGVPLGTVRYPLVVVVPLATQIGSWAEANPEIYPVLSEGVGNLRQRSVVLLDQVRAIDVRRIGKYLGQLSEAQYLLIALGLGRVLS